MNTQQTTPAQDANSLTSKAMLVSLQIKVPSTTKKDKQATKEVTASHHAEEGVARVNKTLYPKDAIQGFSTAAREARAVFYEFTLPWASPQRILLASGYFKLMEKLDKQQTAFWRAAEKFLEGYSDTITEARKELGSLFREEDYPTAEELREKFSFDVAVQPLTNSSDWRVSLGDEAEERIKSQMEKHLKESYSEAMKEPWDRLKEVLSAMAERLSDPNSRFAGTLVTNISDLCDVLPDLNLSNDPKLAEITDRVKETLANQDPKELRENLKVRRKVASEAEKLAAIANEYSGLI